jgi:hypothetical protein
MEREIEKLKEWVAARRLSYPVQLSIYGDATGNNRHTSASRTGW